MPWSEIQPDSVTDLFVRLARMASQRDGWLCRGEPKVYPTLHSKLDRCFEGQSLDFDGRRKRELEIASEFLRYTQDHLGPVERNLCRRGDPGGVESLQVQQHYGIP